MHRFCDEITVHQDTFPANSELSWHWPLTPSKNTGVYGYNALSYGSYYGGIPETPITPRQIKDIATLSETFRFTVAHPIGEFNVLTEFFLGDKSGEKKTNEVGFFLHIAKSAIPFVESGKQLGTLKDTTGRDWKVVQQEGPQGPYYMFVPTADVLTGSIDFKAALDFLSEKKKITGEEWFHGLAFGVEPVTGSGSMKIESLEVSYKSPDEMK